jgi:hypothetical protein
MLKQPASSNPIDTGASPYRIDVLHGHFSSFFQALATTNEDSSGPEEGNQDRDRAEEPTRPLTNRDDHHHVGARCSR